MQRTESTPCAPAGIGSGGRGLRWPCIVNLPAVAEEEGGLRGRLGASWRVARAVWSDHPSLPRSLALWVGLGCLLMGAASALLGAGSTPGSLLGAALLQGVWVLVWLVLAGLHLGCVRGEDGVRKRGIGIPNGLTLLRILLIPATCWTILAHPRLLHHGPLVSALIFVVGFTDVLDGALARLLSFQTVLGRYLDHVADVLICSALALAEHWAGLMPLWLTVLYLFRYLGAWTAGTFGLAIRPNLRISPSFMGKVGTLIAGSTLFLTIAQPLVAPGQGAWMVHLHRGTAIVIAVNVICLVAMALRGTAFEQTAPRDASPGKET